MALLLPGRVTVIVAVLLLPIVPLKECDLPSIFSTPLKAPLAPLVIWMNPLFTAKACISAAVPLPIAPTPTRPL